MMMSLTKHSRYAAESCKDRVCENDSLKEYKFEGHAALQHCSSSSDWQQAFRGTCDTEAAAAAAVPESSSLQTSLSRV